MEDTTRSTYVQRRARVASSDVPAFVYLHAAQLDPVLEYTSPNEVQDRNEERGTKEQRKDLHDLREPVFDLPSLSRAPRSCLNDRRDDLA